MGSQLPLSVVEGIINNVLDPYSCQCQLMGDGSLAVNVQDTRSGKTSLTVVGIPPAQYRDEPHIRDLALSIRGDLSAIVHLHVQDSASGSPFNSILGFPTPH
jgi:hypothetical protein